MLLNIKSRLSGLQKSKSFRENLDSRFRGNDNLTCRSRESGNPFSKLKQWLWFIGLYVASLIFLGLVMVALRHLVFLLP